MGEKKNSKTTDTKETKGKKISKKSPGRREMPGT
jgi:hypothetical protein